jgi:NADH-quinone oxidoreductase subunit C
MSITVEQLAAEFEPLAVKVMVQLPPALPPPPPPKPVAPKPAAVPTAPSVTGAAPAAPAAAPIAPAVPPPVVKPAPALETPAVAVASKPVVAATPPPPVPKPVQIWKFEDKGIHLEATVEASKVVEAAQILDRHGFAIDAVTGMDWPAQGLLEVIYDFLHFENGLRVAYRARIPRNDPQIATISKIFPGADWHERETHDFFGINFVGHRDLTPFLLPDDATYHPLLKDFKA